MDDDTLIDVWQAGQWVPTPAAAVTCACGAQYAYGSIAWDHVIPGHPHLMCLGCDEQWYRTADREE